MNITTNPEKLRGFERHIKVEKISRRSILKGLGITGALVLAANVRPDDVALTGRSGMAGPCGMTHAVTFARVID